MIRQCQSEQKWSANRSKRKQRNPFFWSRAISKRTNKPAQVVSTTAGLSLQHKFVRNPIKKPLSLRCLCFSHQSFARFFALAFVLASSGSLGWLHQQFQGCDVPLHFFHQTVGILFGGIGQLVQDLSTTFGLQSQRIASSLLPCIQLGQTLLERSKLS